VHTRLAHYRGLGRTMLLMILLVSFVPVALVSGLIYLQLQAAYQEKVASQMRALVLKHSLQIDEFLQERLANIQYLTRALSLTQLADESFLREKLSHLKQVYGTVFVDLSLVDADGTLAAYAGPFQLGKASYASAAWFQQALRHDYTISNVFLGLRGLPHFIVAVRLNHDQRDYILRATIDFVAFNARVESIRSGQSGMAYIVNRDNEFQTRPPDAAMSAREDLTALFDSFFKARVDRAGESVLVVERPDAAGVRTLYCGALLKDGEWLLVYQQRVSDAFSDLNRTRAFSLLVFAGGGLLILIMALLLTRRTIGRIAQADHAKEVMNQQVIETGKLASVGELAAGIAHEINNPVAIMVEEAGWIEDLLQEEDLKDCSNLDEFKRALKQIRNQGNRCKEITHKLLSFARKTDSRIQDVQVNNLIQELISLTQQRARYNMVDIQAKLAVDLPRIRVSTSELQQVFLNLINNALDAMDRKGGVLTINTQRQDHHILCEFTDTGAGIPSANLARIFDPFFTTKPVGKGTGLGLSICYGIIQKMGGTIEVTSAVDVGTTFRVLLPVAKPSDAVNTSVPAERPPNP
jgi:two-component system NtrC family sensor kinase